MIIIIAVARLNIPVKMDGFEQAIIRVYWGHNLVWNEIKVEQR